MITILVFTEVVTRYFFGRTYGPLDEFSIWLQIWFVCLLLGVVEKQRRHIFVDILPGRLPQRYKPVWLIAADILTLIFVVIFFWSGVNVIQALIQAGAITMTTGFSLPEWIIRLSIPIGAIFLGFFAMEHLLADIRSLGKQKGTNSEGE